LAASSTLTVFSCMGLLRLSELPQVSHTAKMAVRLVKGV
jgi:hypothetical protein